MALNSTFLSKISCMHHPELKVRLSLPLAHSGNHYRTEPRQQILNTNDFVLLLWRSMCMCLFRGLRRGTSKVAAATETQASRESKKPTEARDKRGCFCRSGVFNGKSRLSVSNGKSRVSASKSWLNFDWWTLVFCLKNESVAKEENGA